MNNGSVACGFVEERNYFFASKINVNGELKTLYEDKGVGLPLLCKRNVWVKVLTKEDCPLVVLEKDCTKVNKINLYIGLVVLSLVMISLIVFIFAFAIASIRERINR
ncbi:MAG: hypothetical protein II623_07995 [Paludibacteraceae bacterium]|nr:hypothetical protein [Paludibacteraceae bacterium]